MVNKSYISVWNEALGSWVAASEHTSARGKRSKSRVVAEVAVAIAGLSGVFATPVVQAANTTGSGLQLCNSSAGASSGTSWGPGTGTGGGSVLNCVSNTYSFSLNNAGGDTGGNGFTASTARVTGYMNGTLELLGANGISMLGVVQMNSNKMTGLAAGTLSSSSTDAVNGSQLYATGSNTAAALGGGSTLNAATGAISAPSYTMSNANGTTTTVNDVGSALTSINSNGIKYFHTNSTLADSSAAGGDAVAIGGNATASAGSAIAMGSGSSSSGAANIAIGSGAQSATGGAWSIMGIGNRRTDGLGLDLTSTSAAAAAVALGTGASVSGAGAAALGSYANAAANGGLAVGTYGQALGRNDISLGSAAYSNGLQSMALGSFSVATQDRANAIGTLATANGVDSNAIGTSAAASGTRAIALGSAQTATVNGDTLQNTTDNTQASGTDSIAIGTTSVATNTNDVALGTQAAASGGSSLALGAAANSAGNSSVAIGTGASATVANSVALGAGSTTTADLSAGAYNPGSTALSGAASAASGEVSVGSSGNERRVTNVAAGAAETDAVNVSQLQSEAAKSTLLGQNAAAALGGSAAYDATTGAITGFSQPINSVSNVGAVGAATAQTTVAGALGALNTNVDNTANIAVKYDSVGGNTITLGATGGAGAIGTTKITNLTAATLSASSTDAVNGSQLYATNQQVTTNSNNIAANTSEINRIDGRVTNVEGSVTDLTQQMSSGAVGLVKQDAVTNAITVASDKAGSLVDFTGTQGARTLSGVRDGALAAGSTEAVNGSQLSATNDRVTTAEGTIVQNTSNIAANTSEISRIDGRVTNVEGSVTDLTQQMNSGAVGLVKQDAVTNAITVASDKAGSLVDFTGTQGARTLSGVRDGALAAGSTEAVNGSQLSATNTRVTAAESTIAQNTTDIANVQNQLNSGSVGLVQQDANTRVITVAKDSDGTVVNMSGKDSSGKELDRQVTGVANGGVNAASVDAINGSQLYATASSTASGLGGGATVNADGTISAPSYSVGGTTVHSVGDAVANIDERVTQNTTDITKMQNQLGNVGAQLSGAVQYDRNIDGSVNFGSVTLGGSQSAGPVVLTNVANGTKQYDAVNFGQLSALQDQVADINTQVANIQPASPYFSANGFPTSSGAVNNVASAGTGEASTAAGIGASASGNDTTAIGAGAVASTDKATAIGAGAQATHSNSVALGQGSTTDRDNSVSVGTSTQQRQITNVAAGTADTDAVNVGQLNNSVSQGVQQANNYTDQRFNDTNRAINDVAKNAYAGIAAAMAMPNMTPSGPGRTIVAAGAANYKGGSAVAAGATYRSRSGNWLVNGAVSVTSTGDAGVRAQVGYEF